MVCPTCFCSSVKEVSDLQGDHVERQRQWDSCFSVDFSYMNGGIVRNPDPLALPPMADAQTGLLDRPVRHLRLRRLRPLHHLVPGRDRSDRRSGRDSGYLLMMLGTASPAARVNPWQSHTVVIRDLEPEAAGVTTYRLAFRDSGVAGTFEFRPGQFCMLYLPGVGEVPIGISGHGRTDQTWFYTVRVAGNTTRGLAQLRPGDTLGLRGPFGSCWPIDQCRNADVVLVAGGMGLPPLRPVIDEILHSRQLFGRVTLIYGARTPDTLIYSAQYEAWKLGGIDVQTTVDQAQLSWTGNVGVVPLLVDRLAPFDPRRTVMMICGPEVMVQYTVRSAVARGMSTEQIWTSLERNMQCAIGLCGHCQLGPAFLCKDGPVFRYDRVAAWLNVEGF